MVVIAAELAMYLPVPLFGYLCDRIGPAPLSFLAGILFACGYILAGLTYRSGASTIDGLTRERGWPKEFMIFAFVIVGMATTCMYLSAVTTCAKNFGKGKYRGLALACPIAAFGLSGMWLSQVGSRIFYEKNPDGSVGDVDVFKFFIFMAIALLAAGLLGTVLLKIVDEDELIDEAVEELERSGLLEDSEFFRNSSRGDRGYGSIINDSAQPNEDESDLEGAKDDEAEEKRKKAWLLNGETRRFLKDHTMWFTAAGFFFVSGKLSYERQFQGHILRVLRTRGSFYHQSRHRHWYPVPTVFHSFCAYNSSYSRLCSRVYFYCCSNSFRHADRSAGTNVYHASLCVSC